MTSRLSHLQRAALNAMCRQMAYERDSVYWSLRTDSCADEATRYPTTTQGPPAPATGQESSKTDAGGDV